MREKHRPAASPTGDQTCHLGTCPDWQSNPQPFGTRDNTPTESPATVCTMTFKPHHHLRGAVTPPAPQTVRRRSWSLLGMEAGKEQKGDLPRGSEPLGGGGGWNHGVGFGLLGHFLRNLLQALLNVLLTHSQSSHLPSEPQPWWLGTLCTTTSRWLRSL